MNTPARYVIGDGTNNVAYGRDTGALPLRTRCGDYIETLAWWEVAEALNGFDTAVVYRLVRVRKPRVKKDA